MANVLRKEQADEIRARLRAEALEELLNLGAQVSLNEPGCTVVVLHSVEGKRRNFTGISPIGVLEDVKGFLAHQAKLKEDAPSRFVVSMEPTPEVEVVAHDIGSENSHKRVRREIEFDATGRVLGHTDRT